MIFIDRCLQNKRSLLLQIVPQKRDVCTTARGGVGRCRCTEPTLYPCCCSQEFTDTQEGDGMSFYSLFYRLCVFSHPWWGTAEISLLCSASPALLCLAQRADALGRREFQKRSHLLVDALLATWVCALWKEAPCGINASLHTYFLNSLAALG